MAQTGRAQPALVGSAELGQGEGANVFSNSVWPLTFILVFQMEAFFVLTPNPFPLVFAGNRRLCNK